MAENGRVLEVDWFSDVLCIWAYVGQIRIDEALRNFGSQLRILPRSVVVFGNNANKIGEGWADRGGYAGYAAHVQEIGARYDHVTLHPDVWTREIPVGSLSTHAFAKAVELVTESDAVSDSGRPLAIELSWRLRVAFFRDLRDVARFDVMRDVAAELDLPLDEIQKRLEDGTAMAALAADHELGARNRVKGSPTFLLDGGRQMLYGNVGYRVIDANVRELLTDNGDKASWC